MVSLLECLPTWSYDEKEMSGAWMRMSNDLDSLICVRRSTSGVDCLDGVRVLCLLSLLFATTILRSQYCMSCVFAVYSVNDIQVKLSIRIQEK